MVVPCIPILFRGFKKVLAGGALAILAGLQVNAATLYVNGKTGNDAADGKSSATALRTVQKACDLVAPGDTVIIAPGVYLERVQLKTAGTKQQPITFKADRVEKNRVILSGAVAQIRNREAKWQLEDEALHLYSVPLPFRPARVLYDQVDLLPYPSLECLKNFRFADGYPGNPAGFAQENGRLYVRLRADCRYGSYDPNEHTMAVSTPIGGRHAGLVVTKLDDYIFGVLTQKPAYLVLDGFTFETPGTAGVYVEGSYVTVRNSWFVGCRSGVSGRWSGQPHTCDPATTTNNVTIEYCDIHAFPAFDDMKEIIENYGNDPYRGDRKNFHQRLYWWQRKDVLGYAYTYETGIGTFIGNDWVIRHNYMHDSVEYLSTWATAQSRNLKVCQNRFERLVDNALEAEDHAYNEQFFENEIVDVFEPFSWQPLDGTPWPGPIYIYRNLVWMSKANVGIWNKGGWDGGIWKLGAQEKENYLGDHPKVPMDEPVRAAGEGFLAFNNTVYCPDHEVLTRVQSEARGFENFHIFNNLVVVKKFLHKPDDIAQGIDFYANVTAFTESNSPKAAENFVQNGGASLKSAADLDFADPANGGLELGSSRPVPKAVCGAFSNETSSTAGAIPFGKKWKRLVVGPRTTAPNPKD
ncbi:MAG: hypothetical protein ACFUZC_14270 [Chthoniobacteraceae bacterium]